MKYFLSTQNVVKMCMVYCGHGLLIIHQVIALCGNLYRSTQVDTLKQEAISWQGVIVGYSLP